MWVTRKMIAQRIREQRNARSFRGGRAYTNEQARRNVVDHLFGRGATGGYPATYLSREGSTLCGECALDELQERMTAAVYLGIYYEGPAMCCDNCGTEIESAYGDPDEETEG